MIIRAENNGRPRSYVKAASTKVADIPTKVLCIGYIDQCLIHRPCPLKWTTCKGHSFSDASKLCPVP
jgi:hypothetical protein